jgi:hypothetical protein
MRKLSLAAIGLLATLPAFSVALPPGSVLIPPFPGGTINTPFVASATTPFTLLSGGTGNFIQAVAQVNPSTFDFYYQVQYSGGSLLPVLSVLLNGFAGYGVDFSLTRPSAPAAPFVNASSGARPVTVTRSADGNRIFAGFVPGIFSGNVSSILILRVSGATGYTSLIPPNSGAVGLDRLASQYAPTPEPSFYVAVSLGLAGLFLARRRSPKSPEPDEC